MAHLRAKVEDAMPLRRKTRIKMKMKRGRDVQVAGGVGATPARAAGWAVTR